MPLDNPSVPCYPSGDHNGYGGRVKIYHGSRDDSGTTAFITDESGRRELDPRFDLRKHSMTGFEWGYAGSGPAQLALALAADALGDDDRARDVYQQLKFKLVASLGGDTWSLTEGQVRAAVADIERAKARVPGSRTDGGPSL
jgi:hypothetical protein